jgi:outer membrane protein OmpA-like peptidoglycan-associated protein
MWKRASTAIVVAVVAVVAMLAATASAQTSSTPAGRSQQPAATSSQAQPAGTQPPATANMMTPAETRPATTTFMGDTGLWFVPTGEVLPPKRWSFSLYRVNFDYTEGFTDVSNWPITFGAGLGGKAEIFGAVQAVRRIDRDARPIFFNSQGGGVTNEYPLVRGGWSDNQFGDIWVGAKVNLSSQFDQKPVAFGIRGLLKIPTANDDDEGVGTGKVDFAFDGIVSKEVNDRVEFSGYGGYIFRSSPDDVEISNGFRYGFGVGTPSRKALRLTAEIHGEAYTDDTVTLSRSLVGEDGSIAPATTEISSPFNASVGLTFQSKGGVFAGAGLNYRVGMDSRSDFGDFGDETGDSLGFQLRVGYHPGVRIYVPPPPPPTPAPPAAKVENRPPTVTARCEPCTVEVGRTSTVTCDASDPDGDPLTYKWSAPTGKFTAPTDRQTPWTAPMQEGPVQVMCAVADGKGGTASSSVTIQVIRPARKEIVFEDVHFDFDRYSLRPEATRALDEAIRTLKENADLRLEIEGHTCNIGTAEYNLALGERRANAVREYLAQNGIGADRLRTVSYGEERPKHDNSREETRRLNRRAALLVRVQ